MDSSQEVQSSNSRNLESSITPTKSQFTNSELKYREKVKRYASSGEIRSAKRRLLNTFRLLLGLSFEESKEIEYQVLQLSQKRLENLQCYRAALVAEANRQYPFSPKSLGALKDLQDCLGLSKEDVLSIESEVILEKEKLEKLHARATEKDKASLSQASIVNEKSLLPFSKNTQLSTVQFEVVTVNDFGHIINRQNRQAEIFIEDLGERIKLEMVVIRGGTFIMGAPTNEVGRHDEESLVSPVSVQTFLMGRCTITQEQWRTVALLPQAERSLDSNPSHFTGDTYPVEQVSWYDATEFCKRLALKTGRKYRLPTEKEWEYACRAGTKSPFHFGETIVTKLANYDGCYRYGFAPRGKYLEHTTQVGSFKANGYGLYDMHGNVWEWCLNSWHPCNKRELIDEIIWDDKAANERILRGGSWMSHPNRCRSAARWHNASNNRSPIIGFRVALSLPD